MSPVLEIKGDVIVVEKTEGGELKVGAKVTITYTMTAESIEVKPEKK